MAQPSASLDGIALRTGSARIPAVSSAASLRRFVADANAVQRIEGLPDDLNPAILDPDKVVRLAAALPRLPPATLARLAGHELYLDEPGLQVRAAFPSRAESFERPFALQVGEVHGKAVMARVDLLPDLELARSRTREAASRHRALAEQEQAGSPGASSRLANERRIAVARTWRMNALAWAQAAPSDPEAKHEVAAAEAAVSAAPIAPRGGTVPR
jgi:hypothetical protein